MQDQANHNPPEIIIISPAFPFRGGIAATSDRLALEYTKRGKHVEIWTYKMLYPKFIFPGKSQLLDLDKHQAPTEFTIRRKIVSINPFNWLKIGKELRKSRPKKIIIRYWLPFLAPCLATIARIAKKNNSSKIIGLIDNVKPHESRMGDHFLSNRFYQKLDGFLVMAQKGVEQLKNEFNIQQKITYSPHPLFDIYGDPISKKDALEKLNLDPNFKYILSFGLIRKYKGIDLLIEAFKTFASTNSDYKLLLVGECYDDWSIYQNQIDSYNLQDRIIRFDQFVPDNEVKHYFSAAEFLALTYRSATQSGVTQIAYSMELPILVTNVGDLPNMVPHQKVGLVTAVDPTKIAASLTEMATENTLQLYKTGIIAEKDRFSWSVLCDKLDEF